MADNLLIALDEATLEALDCWRSRHTPPCPSREQAVVQLVMGVLGTHSPSTIVPPLVTGRDIV